MDPEQTSYSLDEGWSSKFPALFHSTGNILWRTPEGSPERNTDCDNDDMKEGEKDIQPWVPDEYSALKDNEFRIVQIHQSTDTTQKIQASLYKGEIDNCPPYNALSYIWGSLEDSKCIELNNKPVFVRSNLYHALHRFRSTTEPVLIWVDALCIIQADDEERSDQVRRM